MSIERHVDDGWVSAPAKSEPTAPVFRSITPGGRYYAHEADTTTHDGVYMAVKSVQGRNELAVTFGPPGAFIVVDLTLDAGLALLEEIRKALEAAR